MNFIGQMCVEKVYFSHSNGIGSLYKKTVVCRNYVNNR